jgi:hypothetical protein
VPTVSAALDAAETGERWEVEGEDEGLLARGLVEQAPFAGGRSFAVLVPDRMPLRMLEMDGMQGGIRNVEKLLAVRLERYGHMPFGVPGRRQHVDARRERDLPIEQLYPFAQRLLRSLG